MSAPDLANQSPFIVAAGLEVAAACGTELTGHIDATADHQTPWGVVHGGVYATAVERAASIGASLVVREQGMFAVGLSDHTDLVRAHREGRVRVQNVAR